MDALELRDHGAPSSATRHSRRRTHLIFCLKRFALRSRFQPLFQRSRPPRRSRPSFHPRPRITWAICPRISRGQTQCGKARRLQTRKVSSWRRTTLLPTPKASTGILGIPDSVNGAWAHQCHLPGTIQPLPAGPWL